MERGRKWKDDKRMRKKNEKMKNKKTRTEQTILILDPTNQDERIDLMVALRHISKTQHERNYQNREAGNLLPLLPADYHQP